MSHKVPIATLLLICLLSLGNTAALAQDRSKPETIDATARGTSAQMGREVPVKLIIYDYSTAQDKQVLMDAFQKGKNQGLVNALSKMKAVGHIAIGGTIGYDVSYIEMTPTATGRRIRFVTNRVLKFGELYWDTRSTDYNLTAGELDLNDQNKSQSTGRFYPAAEFAVDKQGQLQINTLAFPFDFVGIIDWQGTPGVN